MRHESQNLGYELYKIRISFGMTQTEMAELVGLSVPYYSTLERNKQEISFRTAARLRNRCGLDLNALAERLDWDWKKSDVGC